MNNLPRQKLLEIVGRHGLSLINEPRRCEGLMRDYFPTHRREIAVLTTALEERIPVELLAPGNNQVPHHVLFARLARRLRDEVAMEEQAALWSVHTWALALGVVTADALAQADAPHAANPPRNAPSVSSPAAQQPARTPPSTAAASSARTRTAPTRASFVVAADGGGDFSTIGEAIRRASAGARLLVRPGIYREGFVIDKALDIIGDGALEEIVVSATTSSCLLMQTSAAAAVRNLTLRGGLARGAAAGSTGFFAVDIPHGRLLLEGCDISSDSLSCVAIHNSTAEPTIRRCRIHHGADSGVYAFDAAGGTLEACDIFENANVGVAVTNGARTSVSGCHVHHGGDAGVVVWGGAANAIEDCDIYLNAKTNVGASDKGQTTLRRCRIHEGHNTGVFVHRDGRAALEECNIYRHPEAEVAATSGGDIRLRNCRIHQGRSHGVFVREAGQVLLEACDVLHNNLAGVHVDAGGVGVARSCRINENNHVGVSCEAGGAVTVEDCELQGNRVAAWRTHHGSLVESRNNRV